MKRISIKERLILYFVLLGLVSIAIVSLFSIYEAKKGIRERVFSQLILLRDLRREQVQAFYTTRSQELRALANSGNLRETLSGLNKTRDNRNVQHSFSGETSILDLVTDRNHFKSLIIITGNHSAFKIEKKSDGFQIGPDSSFQVSGDIISLFSNPNEENTFFIREQINQNNEYQLLILVPLIIKEEGCQALLVSELNPEALQSLIYDKTPGSGMGRTGEAYLAGTDGFMRSPSRFLDDAVMKIKVNTVGFKKAIAGLEGTGIYDDYRGIEILGAYGIIETGGLKQVIFAEIDVSEAMVPLNIIRTDILMVSAIILMAIFIVTWVVAHGITRPLIRLKNAANFISAGNYSQNLEIESDDEIGELTGAFNTMSRKISSATLTLKEKEESLRHFYDATLDGIVLHDEGRMVLFNAAMIRLTGYTEEELQGLCILDVLMFSRDRQCDKNRESDMYETALTRKDKSVLPVEVQESCVEYKGKSIRASVIRDISARKKMEEELANERTKRVRAVFDGKDSEQHRLSRELHDGLGQQLVAGKLILESSLYDEGPNLKTKIMEAQAIFDQIIGEIRRISHDLSPSILTEFGLKAAVENLCRNIIKATGITINLSYEPTGLQPDELTSAYLYRIMQESLNNIQIHSGASHVGISLMADQDSLYLEIGDDGKGFDMKKVSGTTGTGLYNMRERVHILKGEIKIISSPGKGTKIRVRIPYHIEN